MTEVDAAATGQDELFVVPASYAQERVWFTDRLSGGRPLFNVVDRIVLPPGADAATALAALEQVVERHEVLRTELRLDDGVLCQVVHPTLPIDLPVTDLTGLTGPDRERACTDAVAGYARADLPVDGLPLWRARLLRLDATTWWLLLVAHHVVVDGTALLNLHAEIAELCAARVEGRPAVLPDLPIQYADFAVWERDRLDRGRLATLVDHWRTVLAGLPAVHSLPTDRPRPPVRAFTGADARREVPARVWSALPELTRASAASPFMVLLSAFAATLHRQGGGDDIVIGLPVAGRDRAEVQPLLGMFVNVLVLRIDVSGDPPFRELVGRVRRTVLDAWEHQDLPFQKLVEAVAPAREPGVPPLYQVTFNHLPSGRGSSFGVAADDLALEVAGTEVRLEYDTALFDDATAHRLADHYLRLLVAAVDAPDTRVGDLPMAAPGELERVLVDWNATSVPGRATTLGELVAAQAARSPDAVAVVDEHRTLRYAELDADADAVARRLLSHGVGRETVVAVHAARSVPLVVGLLGVLRAGAAYLPLDPDYPAGRLAFMLADAGATVVLADEPPPGIAGNATVLPLSGAGDPGGPPIPAAGPDNAAYVIYTSGSTGRPKGVVNTHAGIVNRIDWMQAAFGLGPADTVLHKTPIGFDVSVWEIFWPLTVGARLVLARPGGHRDPAYLRDVIARHRVSTVHFVPSMLAAFLAEPAGPTTLTRIVCSGEELPLDLARRCVELLPGAQLHNLYGPTEAAVDVTAWHCAPDALAAVSRVPIGAPIHNTRTYVLDAGLRPVPVGVAGQLHLGGVQVARGYLGRPALTAQRFVPDPFGPPGGRLYATGDLARWRPDGTLEFLGRADDQVKLRGLRIEPGEIAAVLREQPGVRDAAVVVRDQRLVAYLTGDPDLAAARTALRRVLPEYMVPAAFVVLDTLPLSPNGKLDRAALPAPTVEAGDAVPETPTERAVAAVWQDVLGVERVGLDDDFFDLGGHSLLAITVLARLRDTEGVTGIGVMDLFGRPTVRGLAELVDGPARSGDRPLLYELTPPVAPDQRVCSYVCVPYGGGLATVFQPLADALPPGHTLYSVAIPGHDVGVDDEELPFDELVARCVEEILATVSGPLVLYGHCVGGALLAGIARELETRDRPIEAVYAGGVFPTARPGGLLGRLVDWVDERGADRGYENFLRSIGAELAGLDQAQVDRFVHHVRREAAVGAEMFTRWIDGEPLRVRAPVISVVGGHDVLTEYHEERYREWAFLGTTTALVVLDEAGHYFVDHRASELAEIVTTTHLRLDDETPAEPGGRRWRLAGVDRGGPAGHAEPVQPGVRRFLAVAAGQLISLTGSALTQWAVPVWVYLTTDSLLWFGLAGLIAYLPALLTLPVAGAVADRFDRRRVLLASCLASAVIEVLLLVLVSAGEYSLVPLYVLVSVLGAAAVFQRIAFLAAIPQVMPKRYLGHANGIAQLATGMSALAVPLLAAGLLAAVGLVGVLLIDIASYVFALAVLAFVRFPKLMGKRRKETFVAELVGGARLAWADRGFRAMLGFFALYNLCLSTLLLVPPLVLAFGTMGQVGQVAFAEAAGTILGGLVIAVWGGPTRHRMPAIIGIAFGVACCLVLSGLAPELALVAAGSFGIGLGLGLHNGIYLSIIQVKVPQRFHGRVLATIQTLTWATLPLGFAVLVPASGAYLEPLLAPGGALAGTVGAVIGVGPGRGLAFAMIVAGLVLAVVAVVAWRVRPLRLLDVLTPDAPADPGARSPVRRRGRVADLET